MFINLFFNLFQFNLSNPDRIPREFQDLLEGSESESGESVDDLPPSDLSDGGLDDDEHELFDIDSMPIHFSSAV